MWRTFGLWHFDLSLPGRGFWSASKSVYFFLRPLIRHWEDIVHYLWSRNCELQAKVQDGDYVPVHPIEDTIVMNLGDMMQRWSADRLKATVLHVYKL